MERRSRAPRKSRGYAERLCTVPGSGHGVDLRAGCGELQSRRRGAELKRGRGAGIAEAGGDLGECREVGERRPGHGGGPLDGTGSRGGRLHRGARWHAHLRGACPCWACQECGSGNGGRSRRRRGPDRCWLRRRLRRHEGTGASHLDRAAPGGGELRRDRLPGCGDHGLGRRRRLRSRAAGLRPLDKREGTDDEERPEAVGPPCLGERLHGRRSSGEICLGKRKGPDHYAAEVEDDERRDHDDRVLARPLR